MAKEDLEKVKDIFTNFGKIIFSVAIALYLATGFYVVGPDEQALKLKFGKYIGTTNSGIHWFFPKPIGKVIKVKTTKVHRIEVGFQTIQVGPPARYADRLEESLMLTGDENMLEIDFIVQYKVNDIKNYVFNLIDPYGMIKDAAEASMRQTVGKNNVDETLTIGKEKIQNDAKQKLQELLDKYQSGVKILAVQLQDVQPPKPVRNAFKDVASAREDKIRYINEANGYKNDIIPKARGEAEKLINEAFAYKEKRINEAKGNVAKFEKLYENYKLNEEITKTRLYLETMEKVMENTDKIIIDKNIDSGFLNVIDGVRK